MIPRVSFPGPRAWALLASLLLHGGITLALTRGWSRPVPSRSDEALLSAAPSTGPIAVQPPPMGDGETTVEALPDPEGIPPRITAGDVIPRPDTGAFGRGGEASAQASAINLADADERMRLSPDLLSRIDRDQLQRIRVGRVRRTWEDRRSTTHPAELTFVSTGPGAVRERRPSASRDPARGALEAPRAGVAGGVVGSDRRFDERVVEDERPGANVVGAEASAPGLGLPNGTPGLDHRSSARLGTSRPSITRAAVSIPAVVRDRPQDDVDSQQEVATTIRALVHASTAGGVAGDGVGGTAGGAESGSGGYRGDGSTARPLGLGEGDVYDYWTSDPRLLPYFRGIHARIDPLWAHAFPKSAMLELKQGTVILDFTVSADGHVVVEWPPVRPSGVDEFDRNCAEAIRRAAPFGPIPRELGVSSLRIRAPFVASNPIVK